MNRRSALLSTLFLPAAAAALAAKPSAGDEHLYRGYWRVQWCGWRDIPNQWGTLGFWTACAPDQPGHFWAATTLGSCQKYREYETLDTALYADTGPWMLHPNERERPVVKARALALLYRSLS